MKTVLRSAKKTLTDKQSAGVKAAIVLQKLGIGGDIYFFESYLNEKGQRVYKDKNGKEVKLSREQRQQNTQSSSL